MTTSTLELVDWATILDDEPGCESCDRPAELARRRAICGCPALNCRPCYDELVADWRFWLMTSNPERRTVTCTQCEAVKRWPSFDLPWTVVPL